MADGNLQAGVGQVSAGEAKERLSELLFWLSLLAGVAHFASILGQIAVMFMHTALRIETGFPLKSSMLMGNIYLGLLTAYVGRKEFVRWFRAADNEMLPRYVVLKLTRGEVIIACWVVLLLAAALLWQMGYIAEVPNTLLWTAGEVVGLWLGSDAAKYFSTKANTAPRETDTLAASYGDRVLDLVKAHGSIDCGECCKETGLNESQAYRLLKKLVKQKQLVEYGENKGRRYKLA